MNKYLLVPESTMTYVKYLSYKTGEFHDNFNLETNVVPAPLIGNHILYASMGHDNLYKSVSHKANKEYYTEIYDKENFNLILDFKAKELQKIFDSTANVIIIPGIKIVDKVNNNTQYKIGVHDDKVIVIQKGAYTEFINYIKKMPGTLPRKINYVSSYDNQIGENSPKSRVQYLQNVYKDKADNNYIPINIDDFYGKLNIEFSNEFEIDLFVSHQSKDKEPYIDEYIRKYREKSPEKLVWFDRDFFQKGVLSNSNYARNTIAHGLMNTKKVEIVMSNNYFDKLLKNMEEDADYFGINYELALIANLQNSENVKINKSKIYLYDFQFNDIDLEKKIFNFEIYSEINHNLKLSNILESNIKTEIFGQLNRDDIEIKNLKYLYMDLK